MQTLIAPPAGAGIGRRLVEVDKGHDADCEERTATPPTSIEKITARHDASPAAIGKTDFQHAAEICYKPRDHLLSGNIA